MKKGFVFIFLVSLISFVSCRHDPQLANAPEVSFQKDVQPIMSGNCAQSGCHGSTDYRRFSLLTYEDIASPDLVTPGDARKSKLYLAVIGSGGNKMPPSSQPSLSDNQIILIYLWIEQGAKNN